MYRMHQMSNSKYMQLSSSTPEPSTLVKSQTSLACCCMAVCIKVIKGLRRSLDVVVARLSRAARQGRTSRRIAARAATTAGPRTARRGEKTPVASDIDAVSRSRQGFGRVSLSVDVLQRFRRRRRILCRFASGGFCPYTYRLCVPHSRVAHVMFKCRQRPTLGYTVSDRRPSVNACMHAPIFALFPIDYAHMHPALQHSYTCRPMHHDIDYNHIILVHCLSQGIYSVNAEIRFYLRDNKCIITAFMTHAMLRFLFSTYYLFL